MEKMKVTEWQAFNKIKTVYSTKGEWVHFQGEQLYHFEFSFLSEMGSTLQGKNLHPTLAGLLCPMR